jgi:AcrR family transcriptional regulator
MSSDPTDTRSRILEAARQLLEAGQGSGVKMSDIAKAAGISRQAVYLHFPTRAELLIEATRYIDEKNDVEARLEPSRAAKSGVERLDAFIDVWGNYIPEIHACATALIAMQDTDEAAKLAWADRLAAIRDGFEAAVVALENDGVLSAHYTTVQATDLLCALISVESWEHLIRRCGWSQGEFIDQMKHAARTLLVA